MKLTTLHNGVRYKECLKNHAAVIGGTATNGCGEFMPNGEEGTIKALKGLNRYACNCHRKEVEGEQHQQLSFWDHNFHHTINKISLMSRKIIIVVVTMVDHILTQDFEVCLDVRKLEIEIELNSKSQAFPLINAVEGLPAVSSTLLSRRRVALSSPSAGQSGNTLTESNITLDKRTQRILKL
ncbi:hypothetical protein DVH24_030154 [Malus domestica]|uniref:ZF-HD dimerization-type domain-containing protein n=1 Tax=Malus domestica TaxID=3750 RepID=A0A498I2Y5_MALDO|nr:hypothetical protein DVH24_030154 [Malus domestica]